MHNSVRFVMPINMNNIESMDTKLKI